MPLIKTRSYIGDKLVQGVVPRNTDWTRPSDWLPMPDYESTDQVFNGLLAITPDDSNYVALLFQGNYTVDWGDGTIENVASNVKAQHYYDYSAIDAGTEFNLTDDLVARQVMVVVTPQAGHDLTVLNLQQRHGKVGLNGLSYVAAWLDADVNLPMATASNCLVIGGFVVSISYCERFNIANVGSGGTNGYDRFNGFARLKWYFDVKEPFLINTQNYFYNCRSIISLKKTFPLSISGLNAAALSFSRSSNFTLVSATTIRALTESCLYLTSSFIDAPIATDIINVHRLCYSLVSSEFVDCSAVTLTTDAFADCRNLSRLILPNITVGFSVLNCKLSRDAIVDLFDSIGTAAGTQTITLTGNHGVADLTAPDIAIATSKGWTLAL